MNRSRVRYPYGDVYAPKTPPSILLRLCMIMIFCMLALVALALAVGGPAWANGKIRQFNLETPPCYTPEEREECDRLGVNPNSLTPEQLDRLLGAPHA